MKMKHFLLACLTSAILPITLSTPAIAGDQDDLVKLRNEWNQYAAEVPRRSRGSQCSGLSVMRGTAEAFMSRHRDGSYAQRFNAMLSRYNCPDVARLEILPSARVPESQIETESEPSEIKTESEPPANYWGAMLNTPLGQDGSCLTMREIMSISTTKAINKQCDNASIFISVH